ncbi:hypothetical protein QJS10_CPB12g00729 [Acorus calamus]|uniref:Uncharacterized protein n=1 Tax=Acorus calamus TaxID=4465 RepID=A0AAV9DMT4_ACOCL|nr:hypothetical protein QJS10_CPB12g00729 [Acorus calamus]
MVWYDDVHQRFLEYAEIAVVSKEKYKQVFKVIENGLKELGINAQDSNVEQENPTNHIQDPKQVRHVGRPLCKRKVSIREKISKKYKKKDQVKGG